MEVRWDYLTPPAFKKLAAKEKLCVLPMGSLERHGDHLPLGTDALNAHAVACRAAEREPCVVFPPYWFGQVHEAAIYPGTFNLPPKLLYELLEAVLDEIAKHGFTKILIANSHGGNNDMLRFFAMSQLDREVPYTLYYVNTSTGSQMAELDTQWPRDGHAGLRETSILMALCPEAVRLENHGYAEPILPKHRLEDTLPHIYSGLWWYAMYPEQVAGNPSQARPEWGEKALEAMTLDLAAAIAAVKADTLTPELQREFYRRMHGMASGEAT